MNRKIAPEIFPVNQVKMVLPKRIDLGNGIDLFWINDIPDDTIKLDFLWDAGSKYQEKPLVSNSCNSLLFSGNNKITSAQIAENIDALGGYLAHHHHKDHAGFTIFGLKDAISDIFSIVESTFFMGEFPEDEIKKWVDIKKKEFEIDSEKVSTGARRLFMKNIFGNEHPYSLFAEKDDFENVGSADLKKFYNQFYLNNKPVLFLVGNVESDFINKLSEFAGSFKQHEHNYQTVKASQNYIQQYKEKDGAVQSAIRIGKLAINKTHTDYIPFQILTTVLGGYFGSRLMTNIREDKGYTYGIGSGISILQDEAYFFISTEVATDKRIATITEIYKEINRLRNDLIPEDELTIVKNYLSGSFLRNSDGAIPMMEKYKNLYLQNLSEEYYSDYIRSVNEITAKKLLDIAQKYFHESTFTEISYG